MTDRKKIFSLLFGIMLVAVGFFAPVNTILASHLVPPPEAQCEPLGGIAHNYQCIGEPAGVLVSINGATGNLIYQCRDATDGVTLRYGLGPPHDSYYLYCLGSQNERTFKIGGVEVSTTKGILNNEVREEQERLAEKSRSVVVVQSEEEPCGALDQTCKLLKTVGNFFSTIWKGFLELTLGFIAAAFGSLFSGVAKMANGMIGWLMNLTVHPGNPSTTTIVQVGWTMSRDLVNLLFLIVLVFIGLATILRLQTYEMKKTLPLLLAMALLVNFSGVLVGLVVDTGNIITQFFLQGSQKIGWDSALEWPGRIASVSNMTAGQVIAGNLVQIVYYIVATFIFFTLLAVFFIRTFVLWTLAILAPLAFAAYILPATRSIWTKWLGALIQWSFVGVPIAFFMLFAGLAIKEAKEGGLAQGSPFLTEFFGPFTALFFLFIGIGTAITMAPTGASKIMALGKQYGTKAVTDFARSQGNKWLVGQKKAEESREERKKRGESLGLRERIGSKISNVVAKPTRWGYRTFGAAMPEVSVEKEREDRVAALEKKYGKDGAGEAVKAYSSSLMTPEARMAHALYIAKTGGQKGWGALAKEGHAKDAVSVVARLAPGKMKDIVSRDLGIIDDEKNPVLAPMVRKALVASGTNKDKDGVYVDSDVKQIAADEPDLTDDQLIQKAAHKKVIDSITPADLEKADRKLMENKMFREMVVRYRPHSFIRKIGEEWGLNMLEQLQKEAENFGLDRVEKTNPSFINAVNTPWGKQFLRPWEDSTGMPWQGQKERKQKVEETQRGLEKIQRELDELRQQHVEARARADVAQGAKLDQQIKKLEKDLQKEQKEFTRHQQAQQKSQQSKTDAPPKDGYQGGIG